MAHENRLYLLIHTMTIADYDFVIQAQFFHTFFDDLAQVGTARLIGRRLSMRVHPALRGNNRTKLMLQRLHAPNLKTLMKRNSAVVKHHLRTVHIGPEFQKSVSNSHKDAGLNQQSLIPQKTLASRPLTPASPEKKDDSSSGESGSVDSYNQLTQFANPDETAHWLTSNRFEKYLKTFANFSGSDMLRMSREDLIEICGHADGIRMHNALHLKAIAPKLKLYICRDNASIFNAIFLSSHSHMELVKKLCSMATINPEQVKAIYMEGPHSIHVQLSDDVLQHVEEETMFSLNIRLENGSYILLLRRKIRQ